MHLASRLVLLVTLCLCLSAGKPKQAYDFGGTGWWLTEAKVTITGKAKGLGSVKVKVETGGIVNLLPDGSWRFVTSIGQTDFVGGNWYVDDAYDRTVTLVLDLEGQHELADIIEPALEDAALAKGLDASLHIGELVSEKATLKIKVNKSKGTAYAVGSAKFTFDAVTDTDDLDSVGTVVSYSIKGTSANNSLDAILQ